MSWLVEPTPEQAELADRFRALLAGPAVLKVPGAHDALAALAARRAGFQALYLSGAAYAASRGLPDLGLLESAEVAERARDIVRATGLPLLVDVDTGYGGVLNAVRMAREMVEARVAAVQIEDQALPKKCGHLSGKTLVAPEEMAEKIRALRAVAPTLVVVARTDAYAVEGFDAAVRRALLYREAGAAVIFPEALPSAEVFRAFAERVGGVLLANMTEFGRTPYLSADTFHALGYRVVIYPASSLRVAAYAYERLYRTLQETGTQRDLLEVMQTREDLYDLIRYFAYEDLDRHIARSVLPPAPTS
ncbi:MAG: methylisocitrate lyase [Actinomycetia bacterium]|nr:methylisocitrate lyase [Actinomycetes bacterium]